MDEWEEHTQETAPESEPFWYWPEDWAQQLKLKLNGDMTTE